MKRVLKGRWAHLWFHSVLLPLGCGIALLICGCTSKATADAKARAAFAAGQQMGMARAQELSQTPSVTVVGPVRNPTIPWTEGLTLTQALIAAEYVPSKDPALIVILRHGRPILVPPKQLLQGGDVPLEVGDMVDIKQ